MVIGGLGVGESVENMSPHSPEKPPFPICAQLTNPNPSNPNFMKQASAEVT
jgi:hypothetical protein